MKRSILVMFVCIFSYILTFNVTKLYAAENPLGKTNNKMGIHILFPSELEEAAKLVNSNGGEWGYVTVPIQVGDRDLQKWQDFMDNARRLKIIPLVRLATEPYFKNTSVWRKPNDYDLVDSANFLNSLSWPTKNKYVILYNEVNRSDEWGGETPNAKEYADIVVYAKEIFKKRSSDFYLILSGMDAAAPDDYKKYINGFTYLEELVKDGRIINSIDAFSSHSYPNPDFSAPPIESKKVGIASYRFEYEILNKNSNKKLPVFITETGWSDKNLPESVISKYYKIAFENVWDKDKDKIVAITPFLLNSIGGPFDNFSLLKNGKPKEYYNMLISFQKPKGKPSFGRGKTMFTSTKILSEKAFDKVEKKEVNVVPVFAKLYFKTILGLN